MCIYFMLGTEIILEGIVQGVNCRRTVQLLASRMKITGTVENLRDPMKVRIYCETENKKQLDDFVEKLKKLEPPIEVENLTITSKEIPSRKYEFFEIIRGDPQEEIGERFEVAGYALNDLKKLSTKQLEKQDQMLQKQDQTLGAINSMHKDMNEKFDRMDSKYGKISQVLEELKDALVAIAAKK